VSSTPFAAAAARPAEVLAQRHGAPSECPRLRPDLVARRQVQAGEVTWVVKNPETIKYYYFKEGEWDLLSLFDGTRTREQIRADYAAMFPREEIPLKLVLEWEEAIRGIDLLAQSTAEKGLRLLTRFRDERKRKAAEKAEGFNPFLITFHVFDPNRFLDRTVKYVRWIWTPPVVAVWCVLVLFTIMVFARHIGPIWAGTYELYAFLGKPLVDVLHFFFILSFIGLIHEMGHAYATKIYGGQVHDIGMALLYFTPAFYCDTTDSLLFESKWQKLWVTTAGIYIEGFVCAAATFFWVVSYPDSFIHEIAYKTMLFTGVSTIFFNINPLIKIDGYYALSSLLEIPELREESIGYLGALFKRHVLRLPVEVPVVSRRKRRIYVIFGTLALGYLTFVMSFIGGLFFNLYHRYVPDLAVVLLVATLAFIFKKRVRLTVDTTRLVYLDKKEWLMSAKARPTLLAGAVVAALILFVPWTRGRVSSSAALRPIRAVPIQAPEDGVVSAVAVSEGDTVSAGATLLQVSSPQTEHDVVAAQTRAARFGRAAAAARVEGHAESAVENALREASARSLAESNEGRRQRLLVKSPIAGRLLTPRLQDLEGRYVLAGTTLAEVGDGSRLVADFPVTERRLDEIAVGEPVAALSPSQPLTTLRGKVVAVAPAAEGGRGTPSSLDGPPAPGLVPERFVVRVEFDNADGTIAPGSLVRAKIYGRPSSLAGRTWRILWRWVRTIAW
jgi:putative peptide zinc metalloprotease protein